MTSEVQRLAALVAKLQGDVATLARERRLSHASLEGGGINVYQPGTQGRPGVKLGEQYDGSYAPVPLGGPNPPMPAAPTATGGVERLTVRWDGVFASGPLTVAPQDWSRVEVHASTSPTAGVLFETLRGSIESPRGGELSVMGLTPDTDYYVWLVSRSQAGKFSDPSPVVGPVRVTKLTAENIDLSEIEGTQVHYGAVDPIADAENGDLWYAEIGATDDGTPLYESRRLVAGVWEPLADQGANAALVEAIGASTLSHEKAKWVTSDVAPTPLPDDPHYSEHHTLWWIDSANGHRISAWHGDAATPYWHEHRLGNGAIEPASLVASDVIATGTISAALLETVMILTTAIILGDQTQTHVRLDKQGIRVFQPDANGDGQPDEAIRLGTQTGDRIGILNGGALVASMDNMGRINGRGLSVRDWPTITASDHTGQGGSLLSILDRRPRGIVGWGGQYTDSPDAVGPAGVGIFEIGVRMYEGRLYKLQTSALRIDSSHDGNRAEVQIRWTLGGANGASPPPAPTIQTPPVAQVMTVVNNGYQDAANVKTGPVQISKLIGFSGTSGWQDVRFLLSHSMWGVGNTVIKSVDHASAIEMWVEDIGPYTGNLQQTNWGGGTSTIVAPPPPSAPPPQTYNKSWTASWGRAYKQDGSPRTDRPELYQGYGDSYNGNQWSLFGFPDMSADLAGARITGVGLYLFSEWWWNGNGGTAAIGRHKYASDPGHLGADRIDAMAMEPFARGQGRWVDLVAHDPQGWAQGTIRGIVLGFAGAGTNPEYYGRFTPPGRTNAPVVNITYVK